MGLESDEGILECLSSVARYTNKCVKPRLFSKPWVKGQSPVRRDGRLSEDGAWCERQLVCAKLAHSLVNGVSLNVCQAWLLEVEVVIKKFMGLWRFQISRGKFPFPHRPPTPSAALAPLCPCAKPFAACFGEFESPLRKLLVRSATATGLNIVTGCCP